LNGQRLIELKQNSADRPDCNGTPGTEYKTEIDSFSRIVSCPAPNSNAIAFKVWTKAGIIEEYGYTGDSRVSENSTTDKVLVWG